MASDAHVDRALRLLIAVVFALAFASAILARGEVRICLYLFAAPAGLVAMRPLWPQIVIWIMWASTLGLLAVVMTLGGRSRLLPTESQLLLGAASALLLLAIPLVRRMASSPRARPGSSTVIPEARVVAPRHRQR